MKDFEKISQLFGLHPFVGFGMFAVDWMMFGTNVFTIGLSFLVTIPVAIMLSIPCTLIQRFSFADDWGAAIGKGLMVGVLTAIPSPLPSVVPLVTGALGTAKVLKGKAIVTAEAKKLATSLLKREVLHFQKCTPELALVDSDGMAQFVGGTPGSFGLLVHCCLESCFS